ncbi:hypothetical protein [Streptomyces sp. NPDC006134]|uniref:hypothetical protein n=1 Tax=Streptomyces sp. NPDC006134 TaxID=3154467 RepID=UPI0034097A64
MITPFAGVVPASRAMPLPAGRGCGSRPAASGGRGARDPPVAAVAPLPEPVADGEGEGAVEEGGGEVGFDGGREVVAAQEAEGDVGDSEFPVRDARPVGRGAGGAEGAAGGDQVGVEADVAGEGDFGDAVDAVGGDGADPLGQVWVVGEADVPGAMGTDGVEP